MKTIARLLLLAPWLALASASACFADLSGFADGEQGEGGADAAGDRAPRDGAADDVREAAREDGKAPCTPSVSFDASFASDLDGFRPVAYQVTSGHPKIAPFDGTPAAVLLPVPDTAVVPVDAGPDADGGTRTVPGEIKYAYAGIWSPTVVPLVAFDVDVEIQVVCTVAGSCADGALVAWLDLASMAPLTNGNTGHKGGIPEGVAGAAIVLDDFQNGETNDPPPPTIQVLGLDPTKSVGTYPWIDAFASKPFLGAWHRLSIRLRGGAVAVRYDGVDLVQGNVPPVAAGLFGFTAGTGEQTDSVAVRNLDATFYACTP